MKSQLRILNWVLLASLAAAVLTFLNGCSETASSGSGPVSIPQVVINCTTPRCRSNVSPVVHVFITQYDCNSDRADLRALVATSMIVNCTVNTGCYATSTSWVNDKNEITSSIASGTYTVCGFIDYNGNFSSGVKTDDTMSIQDSVNISWASSGAVNLLTWSDP